MTISKVPDLRKNEQIRAPQVRVIDADGSQIGVKQTGEAVRMALDKGLDLVEIAPKANPPVCKIIDYSKYCYERAKKLKESKKHQHAGQLKEVRFRPQIGEHDFETKLRAIQGFIDEHDKVRISIVFRGRQMEHKELGHSLADKIKEKLNDTAIVETPPSFLGKRLIMTLIPKK